MEFFRIKTDIPFMRYALIFNVISLITFLIAVGALATRGLNLGVRRADVRIEAAGGGGDEVHRYQRSVGRVGRL